jgi:hypothetical protein
MSTTISEIQRNSDELRSLEFHRIPSATRPEYFTIADKLTDKLTDKKRDPCDNIPKRRGRKPEHTLDAFKQKLEKEETNVENIHLQTFHFHFSDELAERFTYFATLHRFDERKVFKENWQKWIVEEDVAQCIATEIEQLQTEGYKGDILDKMFKSVRYYYRKKPFEPNPPKTRKQYVSFSKETLRNIDEHILTQIKQHTENETDGECKKCLNSPAKAFADYKTQYADIITDDNEAKYKKTYKNRFFLFTQNIRAL